MNTRDVVAGLSLGLAVFGLAACGGTDPEPEPGPAAPVGQPDSDYPPVPTADDLNAALARGFDPAVPLADKAALVQGADEDPALIDQVAAAALANGATIDITSVDDLGDGTLTAGTVLTVSGQSNPGTLTFVAEDDVWKLSRENACGIVSIAGLQSAACPAA